MSTQNTNKTGRFWKIPYDWRKPNVARFRSRAWNPTAPLINPRFYGWGYDINFYAILHPVVWRNARRQKLKQE